MRYKNWFASAVALLLLGLVTVATAGEAPFDSAPPKDVWMFCVVGGIPIPGKTSIRGPRRTYFSSLWLRDGPANDTEVGAAFGAFIGRKYGLPNGMNVVGQCTSFAGARADAERTLKQHKDSDKKYNYGGEQIDTGWQYGVQPAGS